MSKKNKHKRGGEKTLSSQAKENIYNSGLSYFHAGEYEKAIQVWKGLSKDPNSNISPQLAEAHFRNAISKYNSGNAKDIISEMHSVLKYDSSKSIYLFHTGLAYHRGNKLPQAIAYYTRAVQADPQSDRYKYHLAIALMQNNEFPKSLDILGTIKGPQNQMGKSLFYIYQGDYDKSLDTLKSDNNGSSKVKLLKGLTYLLQNNDNDSKNPLKSAADDKETKGVPDYYLGIAHARTGAMPSAIKAWEDASRKGLSAQIIKDDMVNIYRQLVPVYFDKGNLNKVIKIWEKLLELDPEDSETRKNLIHAYFLRGNEYAKAEDYKNAIKHWEKAWILDTSNPDISHNLALAYEKQKQSVLAMNYWQGAVRGWKSRISANPSEKEALKARLHSAHTHLGTMALELDNLGRAVAEFREALRYDPEDLGSIVKLADLYIMQRNPRSAIRELEKARRMAPKDLDVLHQMSIAYAMDRNILRSVECIKEILRIDPSNETYKELLCNYYIDRAQEARERERYEAALKFLDEGLEISPNNINILALFGGIYLDMDELDKAEDAFRKTIQMNQNNYRAYLAVASYYLESHITDKAELYFAQAVDLNLDDPNIYIEIARECCKADMCKLANEYYEKAKNKKPDDSEILIKIITVLLNKSCSEFAIKYAEELLKSFPDLPRAYYLLASAYHIDENNDEAEKIALQGLEVADKNNDEEAYDAIQDLLFHVRFEKSHGIPWEDIIKRFRREIGDFYDKFDIDEGEW